MEFSMPTGVYKRTLKHNNNISNSNKGHLVSDKTRLLISIKNKGKKRTESYKAKESIRMKEWYKTHDAPMKGRKLTGKNLKRVRLLQKGVKQSETTKIKRIETRKRNKKGKTIFSVQARENLSKGAIKRILNGHDNYARGKKGYLYSIINKRKIWYMSSWEKLFYIFLEKNSFIIQEYREQPLRISYNFNGSIHNYIPDVLIKYKSNKKQLIELKPLFKLKELKTMAKISAAENFCLNNNIVFTLITNIIKPFNDYLLSN
jgi:hypothetical protein